MIKWIEINVSPEPTGLIGDGQAPARATLPHRRSADNVTAKREHIRVFDLASQPAQQSRMLERG